MGRPPLNRKHAEYGNNPLSFSAGHPPMKKQYTMKLPPVGDKMRDAIAKTITKKHPLRVEWEKSKQTLQVKQEHFQKVQGKLKGLEDKRAQALKGVQEERQGEMQAALRKLQDEYEENFQVEYHEKEENWDVERKTLEKEMEERIIQKRKELEDALPPPPPPQSPFKKAKTETDGGEATPSSEATKAEDGEISDNEEGELEEEEEEEVSVVEVGDTDETRAKEAEIKTNQEKVESLTETKSQMVWLLKQVIKAEMKRKMKLKKEEEKASS